MLSRREVLALAPLAASSLALRTMRSVPAGPSQPSTRVAFDVPDGACDCHTHVFGDPRRFAFAAGRTVHAGAGVGRGDARTPPRAAYHACRHRPAKRLRNGQRVHARCASSSLGRRLAGIAVIDEHTPDARARVDGSRGHSRHSHQSCDRRPDGSGSGTPSIQCSDRSNWQTPWHVQMYTQLSVIEAMHQQIAASPVPVVFDHFGGAQAAGGTSQRGFDVLLDLVRSGRAYVKVSAPYRGSTAAPDFADMAPLAKALVAANVQRVLWGTDWPHPDTTPGRAATDISPLRQIDDGRVFNQFAQWVPSASDRQTILVENPKRLYGF